MEDSYSWGGDIWRGASFFEVVKQEIQGSASDMVRQGECVKGYQCIVEVEEGGVSC